MNPNKFSPSPPGGHLNVISSAYENTGRNNSAASAAPNGLDPGGLHGSAAARASGFGKTR